MNKIYKLIWSKVKNMWVVASELAKSHTKSPNSGIVGVASLASLESKINMDLSKGFVAGVFSMAMLPAVKSSFFTITVAAIVKNEAENVPQWVQAARSCADEIVVVDTGSTDDTVKRFADYGIKCFYYDWHDDFASAKNFMISLCHGDWIVLLDGDEWFRDGCDVRKAIAKHHGNSIIKAIIADWICLDKDRNNVVMFSGGAVRAFRNQPDVRYFRKVHENLTIKYENFVFEPDFKMYHTGYSGSVNRSKHERNLRIMRTMFDFDNGKVEFPTDWRYIEDTYAGLGQFDKALWAADKMISYGVQEYSAAAWITKFNVLFAMKTPLVEMRKQFEYCFQTVPSVSGFRFLASIYYFRNGQVEAGLDNYIEGLRMLMGPQDKVAQEHTYWRMYMPEASALASAVYLQNKQFEASLYACKVCEQYCGQTDWTNGALADVRRVMNQTEECLLGNISEQVLPALQFGKKAVLATALASSLTIGMVGVANPVFAACCNLNGSDVNQTIGDDSTVTGGYCNLASGDFSSVSGGYCNIAGGVQSSVSGGSSNTASGINSSVSGGSSNTASGTDSSVSGGCGNTASGCSSSVSGGCGNTASCSYSSVSGGRQNLSKGLYSSVSGGQCNTASGLSSSVSGGCCNTASGCYSSVSGGCGNTASGFGTSVSGGYKNTASYSYSSVSGGYCNTASGYASSAIGGCNGFAYACYSTAIGGGIAGVSTCAKTALGSIAIGKNATTTRNYEIAIGSSDAPVKIGGALTVDGAKMVTDGTTSKTWADILSAGSYTLPAATSSALGGVKIGSNITNSDGTISLTKANVTAALGYTPPTTDTNTHYTTHLYAGSGTAANAVTTNGNTKLALADDSTVRNTLTIKGTGATTVTSDANGVITINSSNTTYGAGTADLLNAGTDTTNKVWTSKILSDYVKGKTDDKITGLSVSGTTITYTKGDGTTGTITTQDTNTTYSAFTGATSSAAGTAGLVKAPAAGDQAKFLRGDGTWAVDNDTKYTAMTADEVTTGTATTARSITAKVLSDYVTGKVSAETTARTTAINSEASTRESADTALSNRIGSLSADGNYIKKSATNNVSANLTALDTQLKTTATAVGIETTARTNADTALGTRIDNVTSAYQSADTGLSNRIGSVASDGTFIKKSATNDVAANLTALDTAAKNAIKGLSVSGRTITYTKGDGTTGTITTQDNNTTYDNMTASELSTGTATTARSISAKVLADYVAGKVSDESTARTTAINTEASTRQSADTALGTRIDNVITAYESADTGLSNRIGTLSADGNYIKKSATNNVSANLTALDTQLKATTTAVSTETTNRTNVDTDLSNRIGTVSADGNYIKKSTTKNIAENLGLLDTQVKANATAIATEVTNRTNAVSGEAMARSDADTALGARIDTEISDRQTAVSNEATARSNADTALGVRIDDEITARENAISQLSQNITTLGGNAVQYDGTDKSKVTLDGTNGTIIDNVKAGTLSANSKEAVIGSQLYSTNQALAQEVTNRTNAIADEVSARQTSDTALGSRIDTEISDRQTAVSNEATARSDADTALGVRIDDEITARENAISQLTQNISELGGNTVQYDGTDKSKVTLDGTNGTIIDNVKAGTLSANSKEAVNGSQLFTTNQALAQEIIDRQTAIAEEKTARETADAALGSRIDTETTNRQAAIADEKTARESADTALGNRIDAEITDRTNADTALDTKITSEKTAREAADTALGNRIDTEVTDRTNADTLLDTKITSEISVREAADTRLYEEIHTLGNNVVRYDDAAKGKVTLAGADGTVLDNVKAGTLSADSKEAVNGSQLFTTNQALAQEITDRQNALADEKTARETADDGLGQRIDTEIADREAAVTDEKNAREAADTALGNRIDTEITDRTNADTVLGQKITAETSARETAVTQLYEEIHTLGNNVVHYDDAAKTRITFAGAEGTVLDNVKAGKLSADGMEAVNGSQLFTTNQALAQEIADRQDADAELGRRIDQEYTERVNAVSALHTRIDDESSARQDADAALDRKIDSETQARENAVNQLFRDISELSGNAVKYDDADKTKITLAGEGGMVISNVKAGVVAEHSMDAVNGGQLYEVRQDVGRLSDWVGVLDSNGNYLDKDKSVSENLSLLDTKIQETSDAVAQNKVHFFHVNSNDSSDPNYDGGGAMGADAIAFGKGAVASGNQSVSIGTGNQVRGNHSGAIGDPNIVDGSDSYVVGNNSTVRANVRSAFVLGNNTTVDNGLPANWDTMSNEEKAAWANGLASTDIMEGAVALGSNISVSLDNKAATSRTSSGDPAIKHVVALGDNVVIGEENAVGIGHTATATALNALAIGDDAQAVAEGANAVGHSSRATNRFANASGYQAQATGEGAGAFGQDAQATANFATAFGRSTRASAESATAIGNTAHAVTQSSIAIGSSAVANGGANTNAVAIGRGAAVGSDTQGYGEAVALGGGSSVQNAYGTALGSGASVTGQNSVALGYGSTAVQSNVVSVGKDAVTGDTPVAEMTRRIVHVADGVNNTDAVNVKQLNDAKTKYFGVNAVWKAWADLTDDEKTALGVTTEAEYDVIVAGSNRNGEQAVGINTIAIGKNATAGYAYDSGTSGDNSIAIGTNAYASTNGARGGIAIGADSVAAKYGSIALGSNANSSNSYGVAVGYDTVTGIGGVAVGGAAEAGYDAVAIGYKNKNAGYAAVSLGRESSVTEDSDYAIALGFQSKVTGDESIAMGYKSEAKSSSSLAIGRHTVSAGESSVVIGDSAQSAETASNSIAVGSLAKANASSSTAIGIFAQADGQNAMAFGSNSLANMINSIAIGTTSKANKSNSVSIGTSAISNGEYSGAFGSNSVATGDYSVSFGPFATTDGESSVSIGRGSSSFGSYALSIGTGGSQYGSHADNAVAVGNLATASSLNATALGYDSAANSLNALALGSGAKARTSSSVAIGDAAIVQGSESVAVGKNSSVNGISSIAIGKNASAVMGTDIISIGTDAKSAAGYNVAIGRNADASSDLLANSVALGSDSIATVSNSLSVGHVAYTKTVHNDTTDQDEEVQVAALTRRIMNVTDGVLDTDAATVGQLNSQRIDYVGINAQFEEWTDANAEALKAKYSVQTKEEYEALISNGLNIHGEGAVARDSIAIGNNARAGIVSGNITYGDNAIAIGTNAHAEHSSAIAIGSDVYSNSDAVAIGRKANAFNPYNIAIGKESSATSYHSLAVGELSNAHGNYATALGYKADALDDSVAVGKNAISGYYGTAIGPETNATGMYSTAIGKNVNAIGLESIALGYGSKASGSDAIAIGNSTGDSAGNQTIAIGYGSKANKSDGIAIGTNANANLNLQEDHNLTGYDSYGQNIAIGYNTVANHLSSTAIGDSAKVYGWDSSAIGSYSQALSNYTLAVGHSNTAVSEGATVVGEHGTVRGKRSTGLGYYIDSTGDDAIAIGSSAVTNGNDTIAIGKYSRALAEGAITLGRNTHATGVNSISIGIDATSLGATGNKAIAVGYMSKASGTNSIAIGTCNTVNGNNSGAFGDPSVINANNSYSVGNNNTIGEVGTEIQDVFVLGNNVTATNTDTVVLGSNSEAKEDHVVSVGRAEVKDGDTVLQEAINRRIVNVGAGVNDTDAVNVSQLTSGLDEKANVALDNITDDGKMVIRNATNVVSGDSVITVTPTTENGVKTYTITANVSPDGQIAEGNTGLVSGGTVFSETRVASNGTYIQATNSVGQNLTVLDTAVKANADAIDANKVHFFKVNSTDTYDNNYNGEGATGGGAIAIGQDIDASGVGGIAIGTALDATSLGSIAIGSEIVSSGVSSVGMGDASLALSDYSIALGSNATTSNEATNAVAIGHFASATGVDSVAIGTHSDASEDNTVSFGTNAYGSIPEINRRLVHVAAGVNDTDAVNVSQLHDGLYDKANWDASNIGRRLEMADDEYPEGLTDEQKAEVLANNREYNLRSWGQALGAGTVTGGDAYLVTGDTVHVEVRPAENGTYVKTNNTTGQNLLALDQQLSTVLEGTASQNTAISDLQNEMDSKANVGLDNITDAGKTVVRDLAKESVKVVNGMNTTVTEGTDGNAKTYAVNAVTDGAVADGNTGIVTGGTVYSAIQDMIASSGSSEGKANIALDNVTEAGHTVIKTDAKSAVNVAGNSDVTVTKTDVDGVDTYNVAVVKTGTVSDGNEGIVTGDTVYDALRAETRPSADGNYITSGNTAGANLTALDTQVKTNADAIASVTDGMDGKANTSLDNVTSAGQDVIRTLAKGSVKVADGMHTTVTEGTDGDAKTYVVNVSADGLIADGDTGIVTGGAVYNALQTQASDTVTALDTKANKDASNVTDAEAWGTKIATGSVAENDVKAVSGDTVYRMKTVLESAVSDGLDGKANVGLDNISTAGEGVVKDLAKGSVNVVGGVYATVDKSDVNGVDTYTVNVDTSGAVTDGDTKLVTGGVVYNALQTQASDIATALDTKANKDASNVTDAEAWGTKIATGLVAENDVRAISGDTAYRMKTALETAMNTGLDSKADNDLSNLTDAGQTVIQQKAISSVKVGDGDNTTVSSEIDADGNIIYKVKANATGTVAANDTGLVDGGTVYEALENTKSEMTGNISGKADKDLGNITDAGKEVVKDLAKDSVSVESGTNAEVVKTVVNGVDTYTVNVAGNGQVSENDTGLVNGGTMYNELRPVDGNYVRKDVTTAANLSALDTKIGTVADGIFVRSANTVGQNLNALDEALYDKANVDASNIGRNLSIADYEYPDGLTAEQKAEYASNQREYNLRSWGQALGAGTVTGGDSRLITGDTLHVEVRPANSGTYVRVDKTTGENLLALDEQLSSVVNGSSAQSTAISDLENEMANKANIALDNINADGVNVVRNIAKSAVVVADGSNTTVSSSTDTDGNITYRVTANATGSVTDGNTGLVDGGMVYTAIENAKGSMGGDIGGLDADGNYIRKANTVAQNLVALDTQVRTNADGLAAEQMARETADTALNNRIGTLTADGNYIAKDSSVSENLSRLDTAVKTAGDTADANAAAIADLKDLSNITAAGETVIKDLAKGSVKVINGTNTTVTEGMDGDVKTFAVNVASNGAVADGDTGLVSGGTVKSALDALSGSVDAGLAGKVNVSLDNLDADGHTVIKSDAKSAVNVVGSNRATVTKTDVNGVDTYTVDVKADGEILADNKGLVDGGMVFDAVAAVTGNIIDYTNDGFAGKANVELDNLAATGHAVIKSDAKSVVNVTGGQYATVTKTDVDGVDTYTVNVATDGSVTDGNEKLVTGGTVYDALQDFRGSVDTVMAGKANTSLDNLDVAGVGRVRDIAKTAVSVANGAHTTASSETDADGNVIYRVNVDLDGSVASGNNGVVSGGGIYNELRPADGNYVAQSNTTAANLTALDVAVKEAMTKAETAQAAAGGNVVLYDGDDKSAVTLGGTDGTVIHNVADGAVSADSKDVVNGGQLYTVKSAVDANTTAIAGLDTKIQDHATAIAGLDTRVQDNATAIAGLDTRVQDNATAIAGLDTRVQDNATAIDTLRTTVTDGLNGKADTDLGNLSDTGKETVRGLAKESVRVADGVNTTVRTTVEGNASVYHVDVATTGRVEFGNVGIVTGDAVYEALRDLELNASDTHYVSVNPSERDDETYTNHGASGADAVAIGTKSYSRGDESVAIGHNNDVSGNETYVIGSDVNATGNHSVVLGKGSDGSLDNVVSVGSSGNERRIVHVADGELSADSKDAVNGKQLYEVREKLQDAEGIDVDKWSDALGTGSIAPDDDRLVKGSTVYSAIQSFSGISLSPDGSTLHVGANNTATVVDFSNSEGNGRVLQGVVTDPDNPNSAANVGYVNAVGQNIIHGVNNSLNRMDTRIDKVGAGAAALASLEPMPFDDNQKWSISAAIGTYHGTQAGAVGVFYKPQDNVMLNIRGAVGNGENMGGAGLSIGLNKGAVKGLSKASMAKAMNAQANEIVAQKQLIQNQQAQLDAQKAEIEELKQMVRSVVASKQVTK